MKAFLFFSADFIDSTQYKYKSIKNNKSWAEEITSLYKLFSEFFNKEIIKNDNDYKNKVDKNDSIYIFFFIINKIFFCIFIYFLWFMFFCINKSWIFFSKFLIWNIRIYFFIMCFLNIILYGISCICYNNFS